MEATDIKTRKRKIAILRALRDAGRSLGASRLARDLEAMGMDISQRTVRYCLAMMDMEGLTSACGKRGRRITEQGEQELANAFVTEKVGFIAAKVDELAYQMSFRPRQAKGTIILNISTVAADRIADALREMTSVFAAGLGMGRLAALGRPGESLGRFRVPPHRYAVGTVCSVTLNGVFLAAGIPTVSRFGGLLEITDRQPVRFTEMIYYDGSSLDPLEIFISGRMTSVREVVATGHGVIGASFREIPAVAVPAARKLAAKLAEAGLGGLIAVGKPNRPLLDIPVHEGRAGLVVVGGLNPLAAVQEAGIETSNKALTGLFEYDQLLPYEQLGALADTSRRREGTE